MAYDLDGTNQQIRYTLNANQTSLTQESWAFWIYPDSVNQYRRPLHKGGGSPATGRNNSFEMDDGWGFVFNFTRNPSGGSGGAWSVAKPSTGAWVHYVVTYDWSSTTNDPLVYKNGVADTVTERSTPSGTAQNTSTALYLGSEASAGQYWDGRIAEVALWNRLLTADEAYLLGARSFSPDFIPRGLVFYADFLRGATDKMGGLSGTLDNTPSVIEHPRIYKPSGYNIAPFTAGGAPASLRRYSLTTLGVG